MANEATLFIETELPIGMTCANATGIEKGAVLMISDPFTAATQTGVNDLVAGIAATEKIASDGKLKIAVYRRGIFKMTLSGVCLVGDPLGTDKSNRVARIQLAMSGIRVLGTALETGANAETILVNVNPSIMATI